MGADASGSTRTFDEFAGLVGRLRLNQAEVRTLLSASDDARIRPVCGDDDARVVSLVAALSEALELVEDDALVARWLRSPLRRRGGLSPLDEVVSVSGDVPIRFVLRPDPTELVRVVANAAGFGGSMYA